MYNGSNLYITCRLFGFDVLPSVPKLNTAQNTFLIDLTHIIPNHQSFNKRDFDGRLDKRV